MVRVLTNVLHLAWTLWFGGMVVLLLFVTQLFKKSHATGIDAAPVLFDTFAIYQLGVGAIACLTATVLSVLSRRRAFAVCTMLLLVAFASAIVLKSWTHRIDNLRIASQTTSDEFKHLHALSGFAYLSSTTALLISGLGFLNFRPMHRTTLETVPAKGSPVAA